MNADPTLCPTPSPSEARARNKPGYLAGQELEAAIRKIVDQLACAHCHHAPTSKKVLAELPPHLKRSPQRINAVIRKVITERERIGERAESLSVD